MELGELNKGERRLVMESFTVILHELKKLEHLNIPGVSDAIKGFEVLNLRLIFHEGLGPFLGKKN